MKGNACQRWGFLVTESQQQGVTALTKQPAALWLNVTKAEPHQQLSHSAQAPEAQGLQGAQNGLALRAQGVLLGLLQLQLLLKLQAKPLSPKPFRYTPLREASNLVVMRAAS